MQEIEHTRTLTLSKAVHIAQVGIDETTMQFILLSYGSPPLSEPWMSMARPIHAGAPHTDHGFPANRDRGAC